MATTILRAKVGPGGRVVIPVEFRRAMGVEEGDEVIVRLVDGEVRIATLEVSIRRAQAIVREHVPEGTSLVAELIAEREAEAARG